MKIFGRNLLFLIFAACAFVSNINGQVRRQLSVTTGATVEIINHHGKVEVMTVPGATYDNTVDNRAWE